MNREAIYKKSGHGAEALAARDRSLSPRLRSLLILVDGKRTNEELAHLTAQGDIAPLLDQLLQLQMIEEAAVAPPPPPAHAPHVSGPAPLTPLGPTVPLPEAQRFVVRRLTDMFGPAAEDMCMKVEATRTASEFMAAMKRVEGMVRELKGPQAAEALIHEIEHHLPG